MSGQVRHNPARDELIRTKVGCIVCRLEHGVFSVPDIHHTNEGMGYRVWWKTYGLCPLHHRIEGGYGNAVHAGREEFERLHGEEEWLLEQTNEVLEQLLPERTYLLVTSPSTE